MRAPESLGQGQKLAETGSTAWHPLIPCLAPLTPGSGWLRPEQSGQGERGGAHGSHLRPPEVQSRMFYGVLASWNVPECCRMYIQKKKCSFPHKFLSGNGPWVLKTTFLTGTPSGFCHKNVARIQNGCHSCQKGRLSIPSPLSIPRHPCPSLRKKMLIPTLVSVRKSALGLKDNFSDRDVLGFLSDKCSQDPRWLPLLSEIFARMDPWSNQMPHGWGHESQGGRKFLSQRTLGLSSQLWGVLS